MNNYPDFLIYIASIFWGEVILIVLFFIAGCFSGADVIKYIEAILSAPVVQKRISGIHYLKLAHGDPSDGAWADNGYLCVKHSPGCGWWGDNGTDLFFQISLPAGAWVEGAFFTQYWPSDVPYTPTTWGSQSYDASLSGGGVHPWSVSWNNTCWGPYGGKDIRYQITFIVSMIQGTDLGEPTFDPGNFQNNVCLPAGFSLHQPTVVSGCSVTKSMTQGINFVWNSANAAYISSFGAPPCGGQLTALVNSSNYDVLLTVNGHTVKLLAGQPASGPNLVTLFGSTTPALPILLMSLKPILQLDPTLVQNITLSITYSYKE